MITVVVIRSSPATWPWQSRGHGSHVAGARRCQLCSAADNAPSAQPAAGSGCPGSCPRPVTKEARTRCRRQRQRRFNNAELETALYLLTLLELQLDPGLDAVAGVLIGLLQGELHEVLVVGARQVPADEDDHVGQDLRTERESGSGGRVCLSHGRDSDQRHASDSAPREASEGNFTSVHKRTFVCT